MLRGADDSTFCSTDCGWSCLIRSSDRQQAAASKTIRGGTRGTTTVTTGRNMDSDLNQTGNGAAMANVNNNGGGARRNSSASRNSTHKKSKRNSSASGAGAKAARPPRSPATGSNGSNYVNSFDGHAMYDFSMKFNHD